MTLSSAYQTLDLPSAKVRSNLPGSLAPRPPRGWDQPSAWSGTISVIEPTGSETHVMLRHTTGQDFTLISRERRDFKVGQTITMTADPDGLHIFDKSTKERV